MLAGLVAATPEQMRRQADALSAVRAARARRDEDTAELERLIVAAVDLGASQINVATAAGLSRQRIFQLVKKYRKKSAE